MGILRGLLPGLQHAEFPFAHQGVDRPLLGRDALLSFAQVRGVGALVCGLFVWQWRVDIDFVGAIKKSVQLVELTLADGVVFMIMTAGASDRHSEPDSAHQLGAVDDLQNPKLFQIRSSFAIT